MRKGAFILSLVMIASASTAAMAAGKAKAPADPNWAGKKFVYQAAMQPVYAWQSVWVVKK